MFEEEEKERILVFMEEEKEFKELIVILINEEKEENREMFGSWW